MPLIRDEDRNARKEAIEAQQKRQRSGEKELQAALPEIVDEALECVRRGFIDSDQSLRYAFVTISVHEDITRVQPDFLNASIKTALSAAFELPLSAFTLKQRVGGESTTYLHFDTALVRKIRSITLSLS